MAQALVRKVRGCHSNDLQPPCLSAFSSLHLLMDHAAETFALLAGSACAMAGAAQTCLSLCCPKHEGYCMPRQICHECMLCMCISIYSQDSRAHSRHRQEPTESTQEETVKRTGTCSRDRKCVEACARKNIQSLRAARCTSRLQSGARPCCAQNASSSVHWRAACSLASICTALPH